MRKNYIGLLCRKEPTGNPGKKIAGSSSSKNGWMMSAIAAAALFLGSNSYAQTNVSNYSFNKTTGVTYTPITGGTKLFPSGTNTSYDNDLSAAITLPTPFTYGGVAVTSVYVSANGYIVFGAAPSASSYTPLSTVGTTTGAIAAFAQDGASSTATGAVPEVSYVDSGTELIVQFKDHANYFNRSTEKLNFQIRLTYATGAINIVYGNCTDPGVVSASGTSPQVGIRGNSAVYATNVSPLMIGNVPAGTTCDWSKAVTGNSETATMLFSGLTNVNVKIPAGLRYTWTPGIQLPVRTFAATTGITATGATLSWTAPTGATSYNVQYRVAGACDWTNFTGNPVSTPTVSLTGLSQNSVYQVQVQALNGASQAMYSHIPNQAGTGTGYAAAGSFTTLVNCLSTVTGLASSAVAPDTATISWTASTTAPAAGYEYYYSTSSTAPTSSTTPSGSVGAGIVTANLTGLTSSTQYYYWVRGNCNANDKGVWSSSANFTTSTLCATVTAPAANAIDVSTTPTITWTALSGATGYRIRVGTTSGGNNVLDTTIPGNGSTSYTFTTALNNGTIYYYSVNGYTAATPNPSTSCTVRNFATVCNAENAPTLSQSFSSYLPSCWSAAKGTVATSSTLTYGTSKWVSETGFANTGTNSGVRINLYDANPGDWLISQPINLGNTAGIYRVKYRMAVTSYLGTTAQTTLGSHIVRLIVSTDGGATWSNANVIKTYTGAGTYSNTGQTEVVNLTGYTGTIKVAFVTTTTSTSPDIDFHLDDFVVEAIPSCAEPTALVVSNITTTTANLAWTASTTAPANGYDVYYSTNNSAPTATTVPSFTGITATSKVLSPLTPSTQYYAWVRSVCNASDKSTWSVMASFMTSCASVSTVSENFDTTSATGNILPTCWSKIVTGSANAYVQAGTSMSAPNLMYIYASVTTETGIVKLPEISNLSSGNYAISFKGRANFTVGGVVQVGYMTNPNNASTFVVLGSYTATSITAVDNFFLPIVGVPSGVSTLALRHNGNGYSVLLDDIKYDLATLLSTSESSQVKNNLTVYPNPFADVLNISDVKNVKSVSVIDIAGRLVKTIEKPGSGLQLGELKSGMYMVVLTMNDGSKQTIKAIKK